MMMRTPVTLSRLDDDQAIFTGTAEEKTERQTVFGTIEATGNYPGLIMQRTVWEEHGRPTSLILSLEVVI